MVSHHIGSVRWNVFSSEPCSFVWQNSISIEIWWDLVSKTVFSMYCDIDRPKNIDFWQTLRNYHGAVSSISANYLRREPLYTTTSSFGASFLLPSSAEDDIKFPKTQGCHVAMHLLHATPCQLREFTLDILHAQVISSSITIDCSPRPPAPVRNFLSPPVNEITLAWNSHRFMGAMYPHILLQKDCL